MNHVGDITKLDGAKLEPVWCITGGSPCQDLSVAGKGAGLGGERSGLFHEQIRIIKEMRQHDRDLQRPDELIQPRFSIWENVPGAFSSNGGEDFRTVLEEFARIAEPDAVIPRPPKGKWPHAGAILGDGWSLAWRLFDAQYWGVPQRRKRIALVADFGGLSAPEILFERKGLSGDSEPCGEEREGTAAATGGGAEGAGGEVAATITATYGTKWNGNAGAYNGQNFVIEGADNVSGCLKTQPHGVCDTVSFQERGDKPGGGKGILIQHEHVGALSTLNNQSVLQIGCDVYNQEITGEVAASLTAASGGSNTSGPKVIERKESAVYDARGNGDGKTVCTITGDHENCVTDYTALCVGNGQANKSVSDKAGALNTMHDQQAILTTVGALCARDYKGVGSQYVEEGKVIPQNATVRRLTPLECERLQGYPDGWTDIDGASDSARYKALGNSIALPQWQWIIDRMARYLPERATLGSLFDGIGGFPLCWERTHGKGTARWASEIEKFPIRVTRIRFPDK